MGLSQMTETWADCHRRRQCIFYMCVFFFQLGLVAEDRVSRFGLGWPGPRCAVQVECRASLLPQDPELCDYRHEPPCLGRRSFLSRESIGINSTQEKVTLITTLLITITQTRTMSQSFAYIKSTIKLKWMLAADKTTKNSLLETSALCLLCRSHCWIRCSPQARSSPPLKASPGSRLEPLPWILQSLFSPLLLWVHGGE